MKTDKRGGASAADNVNDNLERRLSRRFAVEIDRAERDYPALREKLVVAIMPVARGGRGTWPRLAMPITTAAALTVALLIVGSLWSSSVTGPSVQTAPPTSASVSSPSGVSRVVMGSDGIPTQFAGERVYRAADQASFPTSGSFLLGGQVTMPDLIPPYPVPLDHTTAENDLIPYSYWEAIDGIHVAPKVDTLANLRGRIVVARVHIGDAEAALCPVTIQAQCKAAVVVEDVVWTGGAVSSSPAPNPTPVQTTPNSASSQATGPATPGDQIGPDGVPMVLNGRPVYRAASLPATQTFMLGGKLTRDTTCAAPTTALAKPPACGYWMLDGVKIGTMVDLPESLLGRSVAAQVDRSRALAVCAGGSCTTDTLVIAAIVWPELPVATPPAPLTP